MAQALRRRLRRRGPGDRGAGFGALGPAAPAMAEAFAGFFLSGLCAPPAPPGAPAAPAAPAAPRSGPVGAEPVASGPAPAGAAPPTPGQPSALGTRALAVARQEVGVAEDPPASNRGARVEQYQRGGGGQPWCAHFVSWCVAQAGQSPFGHIASVAALRDWARGRGKYLPASGGAPMAGDIFTMARHDSTGREVGGHTGFVAGFDARTGRIRTVEGNAGDRVREGSQALSALDGFIRL